MAATLGFDCMALRAARSEQVASRHSPSILSTTYLSCQVLSLDRFVTRTQLPELGTGAEAIYSRNPADIKLEKAVQIATKRHENAQKQKDMITLFHAATLTRFVNGNRDMNRMQSDVFVTLCG